MQPLQCAQTICLSVQWGDVISFVNKIKVSLYIIRYGLLINL